MASPDSIAKATVRRAIRKQQESVRDAIAALDELLARVRFGLKSTIPPPPEPNGSDRED